MELVDINAAKPGQVIARAVINQGGAVLCPPGFRLTEAAIERLRGAGVDSIVVEANDARPGAALQERIAQLKKRFQGIDDPVMLQLQATIEKRLKFQLMEQGGGREQ